MFVTVAICMIGFACAVGFGYQNRMQRAGRFVDLGKLTTKRQVKLSFGVGFAFLPALIVVWIVAPQQEYIAWILGIAQIAVGTLFTITMYYVCLIQVRRNNILKQLPIILNQKIVLDGSVTADYDFLKHELYLWYGVKYTTKEIDNALTKLNIDLSTFVREKQQI